MKAGPERVLLDRYADRAQKTGRSLGLTFTFREFPEAPGGDAAVRNAREADALLTALPAGGTLIALDEGGKSLDSRAFADRIARERDSGSEALVFAIGGADGLGPAVLERAALRLALGTMTWPHQVVRILVAEQLYRATTILAGHPYHRD
jgi:23S rRNA (pseudouridine1915-N3)-methyltransferase